MLTMFYIIDILVRIIKFDITIVKNIKNDTFTSYDEHTQDLTFIRYICSIPYFRYNINKVNRN